MIDRALLIERIDRAIAEDFVGNLDVTTAPTIPATQSCIGDFRTRKAGVVSGIDVAIVVLDRVCKGGYEILSRLSDGNYWSPNGQRSISSHVYRESPPLPIIGFQRLQAPRQRLEILVKLLQAGVIWRNTRY